VPRLAGQNADYINRALSLFKTGTRASAIMQSISRNLSDLEIRQLADYFSNQRAPRLDTAVPQSIEGVFAGQQLAEKGAANVDACFSCHAARGKATVLAFRVLQLNPRSSSSIGCTSFKHAPRGQPRSLAR